MKKHVLMLAIAITFCSTGLMAQGISGGFKAGLNFANQKLSSDLFSVTPDGRTSFHAGFFATINMGTIGLQPELIYNSVGSKFDDNVSKIDYLTIPVMIRINFAKIVNIHAGPNFGFLLSAKNDDGDFKDEMKGMDLGVGVGIGLDLPMGVIVSARHNIGLSNTADIDGVDPDDYKVTNSYFQLSVGYKLFGK
jgi:hypothetical protein